MATTSWVVAIALGLLLSPAGCLAEKSEPHVDVSLKNSESRTGNPYRMCTADELLPQPSDADAVEWSDEDQVEPPYSFSCAQSKGRYVCEGMDAKSYPKWIPQAVSNDFCHDIARSELMEAPFPPNYKMLFYGNSHMRQVMEATVCMFQEKLVNKRVVFGNSSTTGTVQIVSGDVQCRSCIDIKKQNEASDLELALKGLGCMAEIDNCRCTDDFAEFVFTNKAELHFYFAHEDVNKTIAHALGQHEGMQFSDYDAVVANNGNNPHMTPKSLLESAFQLQDAGTQLFWLTTYEGHGDIKHWSSDARNRFTESGAKFVRISEMARGVSSWRKGPRQPQIKVNDGHFCMPGPPNEMALLLLQLMWAVHRENDLT